MKKVILLLFGLILFGTHLSGQKLTRRYATQTVDKRILKEFPETIKEREKIEKQLRDFKISGKTENYIIPVVFHVVYKKGQAFPSVSQIKEQLSSLNSDFNTIIINHPQEAYMKEKFSERASKTSISFCLAAPQNSTGQQAVNYIQSSVDKWGTNDAIKSTATGRADPWDTKKYLNIWVGHLADSVSGYAQLPGGPALTDGVVIDMRYFGPMGIVPYDKGRTLTHLAGNYLGLRDLWDETTPCGDDGVDDTPVHNAPNYGAPPYRHISLCHNFPVEMTMNFMDNTNDAAQYMFTYGQMYRMQAALS